MGKDESKKIFVNGKKTAHKRSESKRISGLLDVVKTPSTPGNISAPYPNTVKSTDSSKRSKTVKKMVK
jgi:hypothetical protein